MHEREQGRILCSPFVTSVAHFYIRHTMQPDKREHLSVYSKLCKSCGHLDPDEPKKYSKCHHSKGNEFCPAAEVQIVVVGRALKYAKQVLAARRQRDAKGEAKILQLVTQQSAAFVERFYAYLENGVPGENP
ncbi:hypothetical protein [Ralstonia phage phiRSL1]|uniref:Uncharacterized protein n=1 Tax=Ralstonia phage phiRSL1 TaxID=1980924 RepID=B2ZYK0_9CAUD|nr:hypothetical protein RSL1_ORF330 [Ralstonia phage phiRSL1]BAG41776.1 hypothetical protein [Ralstonia phage phiRSL1]